MRGHLVAACAAVLVGLAPAGALPFASVAGAVACSAVEAQAHAVEVRTEPRELEAPAAASPRSAQRDGTHPVRPFRAPSGPAPSQAPPARA
jgi:hypothetical protein